MKKGFTLIEVLVSVSVMLIVTSAAFAIFVSVVSGQRAVLSGRETYGQLSYALEYMSKALRMAGKDLTGSCLGQAGYNYILTNYDNESGIYKGIKFINQSDNNACQEFYLDDSDPNKTIIKEIKNSQDPIALTSEKIKIESFKFLINGDNKSQISYSSDSDSLQPRITISMFVNSFNIQTTISQRNINIK